jgi:class 3 adenylate cyclase
MQNSQYKEKNNIILIILLFVIPLLAINISFYWHASINYELKVKEQEKNALHEAEILSSEADFSYQFSKLFKDFFEIVKNDTNINFKGKGHFIDNLEQNANKIFAFPFPKYSLYVFKKSSNSSSELFYSKGEIKGGAKGLCFAFDYLVDFNSNKYIKKVKKDKNESFARKLFGKFTNLETLVKELKGQTTNTNDGKTFSFFIWDYFKTVDNNLWGCFLFCDELENYSDCGRLLALKSLRSRGQALGAFLPVYKDYGKAVIQHPLEKLDIFRTWAKGITIQEDKDLEKWLKESMPKGLTLGDYSVFCHLKRSASHIAVVLVKSIKKITWPKLLIFINTLLILILCLILFYGLGFGYWPQISLTTRFILSYILASILPVSLLSVASYGYMLRYENTSITKAVFDLQMLLKAIDDKKSVIIKEYVAAFSKAINDEKFIELINKNGIEDIDVAKYVLNIFEGNSNNYLPVLGIKILDESGNGAFIRGSANSEINVEVLFKSFLSGQVDILRSKMIEEDPDAKGDMKPYEAKDNNEELANKAYETITGHQLSESLNRHLSIPIFRKTSNFNSLQIFDFIRINGKAKYMLFVIWDDKTLDDDIVKKSFNDYGYKYLSHRFAGFKIKGHNIEPVGATRHGSKKFLSRIKEIAKLVSLGNKSNVFTEENNILLAMPALNFENIVFVGWIDKTNINLNVRYRKIILLFLGIVSIIVLLICSFRSASVFLKPVTSLKKGLDEVTKGNLNVSFNNIPNDELGQLSEEYTNMISGLREKERLSRLISDQAVLALQKNSNALLDDTETFYGVALVSDIRNFTGMSEQYDPVIITELLNEHFAEMAKIISDNGGLIYKFIGDAIEAVFPEKEEYDNNASERAFKAGCQMILKLDLINKKRINKSLFTYRIGVGLCYGTMFSGTVGSFDTRLDYSILGEPLKKAAKFEALTINNPSFPLVVCNEIAEKIACYGIVFKTIESKDRNFNVYSIDLASNKEALIKLGIVPEEIKKRQEIVFNNSKQPENMVEFSLQSLSNNIIKRKNNILISFVLLFVSFFITVCMNLIYSADYDSLKTESNKEVSRLIVQLNSNEVFKSSFETLCAELYEDLNQTLCSKNKVKSDIELIEEVFNKYEKMGRPIPMYCCCLFDNKTPYGLKDVVYKGFSSKTSDLIKKYSLVSVNEKRNKEARKEILKYIIGEKTELYSMRSLYFRRSALATIENQDTYLNTNFIYDKNKKKILAFIFCAIPTDIKNDNLVNYYKELADKQTLLAFNNNNEWHFSNAFSEKEKSYLIQNHKNKNLLSENGYLLDSLKIGNKNWNIYAVKKELISFMQPNLMFNITIFVFSVFSFLIFALLIKKLFLYKDDSLISKLSINIIISTILPLIIVCFVSYLYVNEDYFVNKTDTRLKMNSLLDELESKDYYYHPFCASYLEKASKSDHIRGLIKKYNSSVNEKEKKENIIKIKEYLDKYICGNHNKKFKIDPYYRIIETIIVGRGDWLISRCENNWHENSDKLSDLGKIIAEIGKIAYLKRDESSAQAVKKAMFVEKLLETLQSVFGGELTNRIINFPNSLIFTTSSFTTVAIYMVPVPSNYDPDYVVISWVFFNNELLPRACELKNNEKTSLKKHFKTGSKDKKLFCFYSPNINVGEYYFYDDGNIINEKEDLQTVKELGLASFWINSSFVPVSRTIDLHGNHYLEARQGSVIKDNDFIALASEIPLRREADEMFYVLLSVVLFSAIMIVFIAQSTISDLLAPVKMLMDGAKSAAREIYTFRTDFKRGDELGALCESFDKMMKGLEEKQLMNRMVSKTALKVSANVADVDSRKINVVLLYITVPGFDLIMRNTPVHELFSSLRKQVAAIAETVINNDGDIDKIMGEKMLIAFHIGEKNLEEVATLACKVAHMIETSDKISFKVSVGVNYGQVISGFLGVGDKRDFTIIGDPVNVAARIAVFAEKLNGNRVVVSENIKELIQDNIRAEEYGEVALKGKSLPLKVFRII